MRARILIVENNDDVAEVLQLSLAGAGFICRIATTGADARRELKDFEPDVIVLDYWVPLLDAQEFIEEIRQRSPRIRIMLITSDGCACENMRKHVEASFLKPFAIDELLHAVQNAPSAQSVNPKGLRRAPHF